MGFLLLDRCLPLNFRAEDLASGILRERVKVGSSLADVDPMIVDKSVGFAKLFIFLPPSMHQQNSLQPLIRVEVNS